MDSTKVFVDKLESSKDWAKWKWHMGMVFRAHGLELLVDGTMECPVVGETPTVVQTKAVAEWQKNDAKAASIIASALSNSVAELVLTCETSNDIWLKLCARFERSSTQRLNMLIDHNRYSSSIS